MHTSVDKLIYPIWGAEQPLTEAWDFLTTEEKEHINERIDKLFANGLPFKLSHDKQLYLYAFSLLAQLELLALQFTLRCADILPNASLKERVGRQLIDTLFNALVFTRVAFMLSAPYLFPPAYNEQLKDICLYIQKITCHKVALVLMNLLCESLIDEVLLVLFKNNVAPELLKIVLDEDYKEGSGSKWFSEIDLPDKNMLDEHIKKLELLLISGYSHQSPYAAAIPALIGVQGWRELINNIHEKYTNQLKHFGITPSDDLELFLHLGSYLNKEFRPQLEDIYDEMNQEVSDVVMSPMRKVLMTEFNPPGDPTMSAEFDLDISDFGFFDNHYPHELLTPLVMQAISYVLSSQDELRDILNYKKLQRTRGSYVALVEQLTGCGDQVGTIFFRNCHELDVESLWQRIEYHKKMMAQLYKKREELELDFPALTNEFQSILYNRCYDIYPLPIPASQGVYLSTIGHLGYTRAKVPLAKNIGLHATLLAVKKVSGWNNLSKSFEIRDKLPISFSADIRIFNGLIPIPELMYQAFQMMLQKMNSDKNDLLKVSSLSNNEYTKLTDNLLKTIAKQEKRCTNRKIVSYLMTNRAAIKKIKSIYVDEINNSDLNIAEFIAHHLAEDYLKRDAEELFNNQYVMKLIDKLLQENKELGYGLLCIMQTIAFDYIDAEIRVKELYQKIANGRLNKLAQLVPKIIR